MLRKTHNERRREYSKEYLKRKRSPEGAAEIAAKHEARAQKFLDRCAANRAIVPPDNLYAFCNHCRLELQPEQDEAARAVIYGFEFKEPVNPRYMAIVRDLMLTFKMAA